MKIRWLNSERTEALCSSGPPWRRWRGRVRMVDSRWYYVSPSGDRTDPVGQYTLIAHELDRALFRRWYHAVSGIALGLVAAIGLGLGLHWFGTWPGYPWDLSALYVAAAAVIVWALRILPREDR